ncbi:MAG: 50S ribosomal protein L31 [Candidatus Magasanikbacteria bacterium CG10_big_fil_rev_8_21_14_0_10_40_10]|uniref:Large ribosomal subunit protein bL31 n=1 Tax=Candidatus Magasanikbacteria bacterium CG10_big_fil_rev_8_21_14_0_10_40_10 TaxID=1974648 RepID=A0A2M6W3D7_9BACT|nr:MAG: 50S ribosomal protein L31 [Candidatus Magasanikbacteria bacterium CG10_big_fil_rev_8_21_14_0_10_40_10]
MKPKIHPQYHAKCQVSCACGNTFTVGSTLPEIRVELCGACHPFYTGKQKFVDTARRVEKFQERADKQAKASSARKGKKAKKAIVSAKKAKDATKTSKKDSK